MACWYAASQMVIQWRRQRTQSSEIGILDPSESAPDVARFLTNNGITDAQIVGLATRLGLKRIPPQSMSEEAIAKLLRTYGPLWVNGTTHIVVIAGVRAGKVYVHDPWPVGVGKTDWRSHSGWLSGFVDAGATSGVFMHCPEIPAWARIAAKRAVLYLVRAGDNLSSISKRFYGDPNKRQKIYMANKVAIGPNPDHITPGLRLTIPVK